MCEGDVDRKTGAVVLRGFILSEWKEGSIDRWGERSKGVDGGGSYALSLVGH